MKRKMLYHAIPSLLLMATAMFISVPPEAFSANRLPAGLTIETAFKPGPGKPVGVVSLVQGEAVVIHKDKSEGYYVVKEMLLYENDTLITLEHGRMHLKLNDESTITLGSETKLIIYSSLYAPEAKTRFALFNMLFGKARFAIKKLTGFDKSHVSVKTKTAIIGVRGSDFVISATDAATEVTALDNTILEIRSLAAIEMKPTLLEDYEKVMIQMAAMPSAIEKITESEKMELLLDLVVMPDVVDRDEKMEIEDAPRIVEDDDDSVEDQVDAAAFAETVAPAEEIGIDADIEAAIVDLDAGPVVDSPMQDMDMDYADVQPAEVDMNEITDTISDIVKDAAETHLPGGMPELPNPPVRTCP